MSSSIPNSVRRLVYRRDDWCCVLCDSPQYIQIHHYIHKGQGGSDSPQNLVTLCADCHALAHGADLRDTGLDADDADQAIIEYLADFYGPGWWPFG